MANLPKKRAKQIKETSNLEHIHKYIENNKSDRSGRVEDVLPKNLINKNNKIRGDYKSNRHLILDVWVYYLWNIIQAIYEKYLDQTLTFLRIG